MNLPIAYAGNQGSNLEGMFLEGQGELPCDTRLPTGAGGRGYTTAQQVLGSLPVTGNVTFTGNGVTAQSVEATLGRRLL